MGYDLFSKQIFSLNCEKCDFFKQMPTYNCGSKKNNNTDKERGTRTQSRQFKTHLSP